MCSLILVQVLELVGGSQSDVALVANDGVTVANVGDHPVLNVIALVVNGNGVDHLFLVEEGGLAGLVLAMTGGLNEDQNGTSLELEHVR